MSISVTRRGTGPALIRTHGQSEPKRSLKPLWIVLALLLALVIAMPAFAQAAPAAAPAAAPLRASAMRSTARWGSWAAAIIAARAR